MNPQGIFPSEWGRADGKVTAIKNQTGWILRCVFGPARFWDPKRKAWGLPNERPMVDFAMSEAEALALLVTIEPFNPATDLSDLNPNAVALAQELVGDLLVREGAASLPELMKQKLNPPTFNHTRTDGPHDPCPTCLEQMSALPLRKLVRSLQTEVQDLAQRIQLWDRDR